VIASSIANNRIPQVTGGDGVVCSVEFEDRLVVVVDEDRYVGALGTLDEEIVVVIDVIDGCGGDAGDHHEFFDAITFGVVNS